MVWHGMAWYVMAWYVMLESGNQLLQCNYRQAKDTDSELHMK